MNISLLAKHAWSMTQNADSLLTRVWKAKYLRNMDFRNVEPKPGDSWGWRSILWAKELVTHNLA